MGLQPGNGQDNCKKQYSGKSTGFKGGEGEKRWYRGGGEAARSARPWAIRVSAVKREALGRCEGLWGKRNSALACLV